MGKIFFEGKEYYEPEIETQTACATCDMYTFRYYPKENLLIFSDYLAKAFNYEKIYKNIPDSIIDVVVSHEYSDALYTIVADIKSGKIKNQAVFRLTVNKLAKVTLTTIKYDDCGQAEECIGIAENFTDEFRVNKLVEALSQDYSSVYFVDLDNDRVYPYRLSGTIEQEYGKFMKSIPNYRAAMNLYIDNTVVLEEREEMRNESSVENLTQKLKNKGIYMYDYRGKHGDVVSYFRMKVVNISEKDDRLHQIVMGFADVNYEKRQELERYAYIDSVTGGDNYTKFKEIMEQTQGMGVLVSMDIHSFKIINAVCGIRQGDKVLKTIWTRIVDWLQPGEHAGHISADHFVIYMAETDTDIISKRLDELKESIEEIAEFLAVPQIAPYLGIAKWESGKKIESAVTEANEAKHQVKDRKDLSYFFYNIKDTQRILSEKKMEDSFEDAIARNKFEVWFQPKFSPVDRKLVGAEALVRWRDDNGDIIPPIKFIPLFERNGMIRILDEYVFKTVCMQQKKWKDEGLKIVPISINLSRASLYFQNVVENYKKIIEEVDIYPQWVPIEITESATIDNKDIRRLADMFFEAGFPLHMDDFGTGYSSLASLNILHFDTLKIDKSLIDYIGNYGGDRLLVHTIALAKELGMTVVAEGVENLSQVGFLKELRCDSIQGFVYSKPLPRDEFTKELKNIELVNNISNRRNFDISQRNSCRINEIIYSIVCEYNALFETSGRVMVPDMPMQDETVYVDIENFKFMIEILIGYSLKNSADNTKSIFTVNRENATSSGYFTYEFTIKSKLSEAAKDLSYKSDKALNTARKIIDRSGGSLVISKEEDQLIITVRMGIKMGKQNDSMNIPKAQIILLVEDNGLNREQSAEVLENAGFIVETAINGYDAVEIVKKSSSNYYSFILMDIIMPVKDGFEAAREIKNLDREDVKSIPIIAVSSNISDSFKEKAKECGMAGYIEKPLSRKNLGVILELNGSKNGNS